MKQKLYVPFFFLFFLYGSWLKASVFINELMPRNVSFLINEEFAFESWVELYNSGAESLDISTFYFSDDANDLFKWQIQTDVVLKPNGFTLVYFDELDKSIHANFKLNPEGGSIYLTDGRGELVDKMTYPAQFRNISYGRIKDGEKGLGFFFRATPGKTNNLEETTADITSAPVFDYSGGFYDDAISVTIQSSSVGAKIYYTTDGTEPKPLDSLLYSGYIEITKNTPLRAIAVIEGALPSEVTTASYFIGYRNVSLPVVSLVTDPKMLYDDEIGMLVAGVNGSEVPSYCNGRDDEANYWNDWDRPCNFELFDEEEKKTQLNLEVKIGNFGACSRTKAVKSIKINATKAHGGNKLNYSIFKEKPNLKWKSVVLRNSGNDFGRSYLRDGFMQTLLIGQMDIDHQAFQPSVVFVNGTYYGMLNIRERTNKDFIYSNYGLDESEFDLIEGSPSSSSCEDYQKVLDITKYENINADGVYEQIESLVDVDEFLNYFVSQIYYGNTDWAGGNIKAWKRKESGKWRWILYDTDFGFSLYGANYASNTFSNADKSPVFKGLVKNDKIKEKLISKFVVHLALTFSSERVIHILDSLSGMIKPEVSYYIAYLSSLNAIEGTWASEITNMKTFAEERPGNMYKHIGNYFKLGDTCAIRIYSDVENTSFVLNDEPVNVSDFSSYYYSGMNLRVTPVVPGGYVFKKWEIEKTNAWMQFSEIWNYYDKGEVDSPNWKELDYDDSEWASNLAPLGYGMSSFVKSPIGYGGNIANRNPTSYFRKKIKVDDLTKIGTLHFTLQVNDGAVVYLNGKEIHRENLPEDEEITYSTFALKNVKSYNTISFDVNPELLVEGENILAVEVHNYNKTNTSLGFALSLTEENSKILKLEDSRFVYEEVFTGGLIKAVFEEDPDWDPNRIELYLNEICVSNSQYVDEFFESDDWIEIYNDGNSPVNIGGMYISDERNNLRKYLITDTVPEKTTVPAKGYLMLWADEQPEQGPLHTNFALPATRVQTVSLSRITNGELFVIDSIRYVPHLKGETYARFSYDQDGDWTITSRPTFGSENELAFRTDVSTVFSEETLVMIYPNPVSETLWFSLSENGPIMLSIFDWTGKKLMDKQVLDGEGLNVSSLSSGFYWISVLTSQGTQTLKFIKE